MLLRTMLAARTRTNGPGDEGTPATEAILVNVLHRLENHAEAEALGRNALEKQRRILERGHRNTRSRCR